MALRETNLIPMEILAARRQSRHLAVWAGALGLVLLLVTGYLLHVRRTLLRCGPAVPLASVQARLRSATDDMAQLRCQLDGLLFEKTIAQPVPYSRVLGTLSGIMAPGVWLTELRLQTMADGGKGNLLTLTGLSFSNADVGGFLQLLGKDRLFDAIVLKYSKEVAHAHVAQDEAAPLKVTEFRIDCLIRNDA